MTIQVLVCGAHGRMGRVSCEAVEAASDMDLIATVGADDSLAEALASHKPDVVVEFTLPHCVFSNTRTIIEHGACPVVGTSGLTPSQIAELSNMCQERKQGGIIAPNLSLGAILMMQAAEKIAHYLKRVEIIEMHHDQKVDSPSGTALKTAAMIQKHIDKTAPFSEQAARGETVNGISVHSVRLPGLFAHQAVLFGGEGETLTIRHDSMNRQSMMPGLLLAIRHAQTLDTLMYGLEDLLAEQNPTSIS